MKLSFCDFWGDFDYHNNFFTHYFKKLIKNNITITSPDQADVLIYSCFGNSHQNVNRAKVKKIFFTGENIRPNFLECDYSFSFDFDEYGGKNIRIPLWYLYIDWFDVKSYGNPKYLLPPNEINGIWFNSVKEKDCCTVFSSPRQNRYDMMHALQKYMIVDGYGRPFGNHTDGEDDKYEKISKYKSNICFENTIYPGYVTEKLLHARTAGTLAIYYGHPSVKQDFNPDGFINLYDFSSVAECAEYVQYVMNNSVLYNKIINQPIFTDNFFKFNEKVQSIL
jgi:hypothetical protein